jgi:hypothetical protein
VSKASEKLVIARRNATKQSRLDCFAEPVIGPRDFARVRWLAMTRSRDAWASEFANHLHELASTKEGGGAPKGAYPTSHAVLSDVAIRDTSAARATDDPLTRTIRFGRARLPALHRGFRRRANAFDSIKAALHAMKCEGITLAFGTRLSQAPGSPVIMPAGTMP